MENTLENIGLKNVSIDFLNSEIKNLFVVQGDTRTRGLLVRVKDNKGNTIPLSDEYELRLYAKRSGEEKLLYSVAEKIGDRYKVYLTSDMLSKVGTLKIQLALYKGDVSLIQSRQSSVPIYPSMTCQSELGKDNVIDIVEIQETIKDLEKEFEKLKSLDGLEGLNEFKKNETERQQAEEQRKQSEEQRVVEETTRSLNEQSRAESEKQRIADEEVRKSNEDTRKANEQARIEKDTTNDEKEQTRNSNEEARKLEEQKRVESENLRVSQEQERQEHESTREENEKIRKISETVRDDNETKRKLEEDTRVQQENARVEAEKTRKSDEQIRVNEEQTRQSNEEERKKNELKRIDSEKQRQTKDTERDSKFNEWDEKIKGIKDGAGNEKKVNRNLILNPNSFDLFKEDLKSNLSFKAFNADNGDTADLITIGKPLLQDYEIRLRLNEEIIKGDLYTLSFWTYSDGYCRAKTSFLDGSIYQSKNIFPELQKNKIRGRATDTPPFLKVELPNDGSVSRFAIGQFKLEKGDVATDFSYEPEHISMEISRLEGKTKKALDTKVSVNSLLGNIELVTNGKVSDVETPKTLIFELE